MPQRIGIDYGRELAFVARVHTDSTDNADVEAIKIPDNEAMDIGADDNAAVTLGVPDNLCQVKSLRLSAATESDLRLRAEFELAHTQLEPSETFQYDLIHTGLDNRLLGMIYRRESLADWRQGCRLPDSLAVATIQYRCRAAALGFGYLGFCRPAGGDLVCLADFNQPVVAICLVHNQRIVDLARLDAPTLSAQDENSSRRRAIDFKTVVNFRLMALAQAGISIPLSRLILSNCAEPVWQALADYFPVGVCAPEADPAKFQSNATGGIAPGLVALGLTVN